MEHYMVPGVTLKFYQFKEMTPDAYILLQKYVQTRISSSWPDKLYDWLGIVGQAIGFPKFHTPGLEYCSVDAIHAMEAMAPALPFDTRALIGSIPAEENPGYLDNVLSSSPLINCYGVYKQ